MKRTLKGLLAVLLVQLIAVTAAFGQDFATLVTQASQSNQQFVDETRAALEASDLTTLRARTTEAVAAGDQTESLLQQALAIAPDDASRSRVEGVIQHIADAVRAGREALAEDDFDAARSSVDAMRGEAQEALSELQPFAAAAPAAVQAATPQATPQVAATPAQLPQAGGVPLEPIAVAGLLAATAGFALRRWHATATRQES